MRKSLRLSTTQDSLANIKDFKKQCLTRTAQRKFATNVPTGLVVKESSLLSQLSTPKTEDFIDFLCIRHAPFLSAGLEVFAEPMRVTNILHNEIFENDDSIEIDTIPIDGYPKDDILVVSDEVNLKRDETEESKDCVKKFKMVNNTAVHPTSSIFKDFFGLVENVCKKQKSLLLLSPQSDWKSLSYVQDNLKFNVKTKHIHRLKLPACENFITLQCIKKQLEKDSVKMNDIPLIGLCEIDLAYLLKIVNLFGGVDSVNSDQNWKALADQVCIPKNASRRVTKLEDIYLKYILPYDLLPDVEKEKRKGEVHHDIEKIKKLPKTYVSNKMVSLETFHRLACNGQYLYWKKDTSCQDTEDQFWKLVNEGNRHVAAVSGEIDLSEYPQSYQNPKCKVPWKMSTIYSQDQSALRFLGKLSKISVPTLVVEGVFSISDWQKDKHGFHTLSYLHSGTEKIWYIIPPESIQTFSKLHTESKKQNTFLIPEHLLATGCQVIRCVQSEGQYVIVEPGCYYCTLSTGYSLSEVVCFASMKWFASDIFKEHTLAIDNFVFVKALLNCASEEVKSNASNRGEYVDILIEKLDSLHRLVTRVLARLSETGIKNIIHLKTQPNESQSCTICSCCCYLFFVRIKNSDNTLLCVNDAIKMINLKRFDVEEALVSVLVSTGKITKLVEQLKTPVGKKKKL